MTTINEKDRLIARLNEGPIAEMYATTYKSLLDRLEEDGFFPESIGGGYGHAEFFRTVGAVEALFSATGEYEKAQRVLAFALESAKRAGLTRIPHIGFPVAEDGTQWFSLDDEVDGTLHVLGAYARLGRDGHLTPAFEDEWYPYVRQLLNVVCDMPYFYYNDQQPIDVYPFMFPPESMRLVYNCAFEHSREGRRWSCFDLLTQCFFGGALEAMIALSERRGESGDVAYYSYILTQLKGGVEQYMTRELDGKKMYLEMRLPDGGWGQPFTAVGFLLLSPMAARWNPLTEEVLDTTVTEMRRILWRPAPFTDGLTYMCTDQAPDGSFNTAILGKGIGWDIAYSTKKEEWGHILRWFDFLAAVNQGPVLAENLWLSESGWNQNDPGNGEQCSWWCWAIAELRKTLGLDAAP